MRRGGALRRILLLRRRRGGRLGRLLAVGEPAVQWQGRRGTAVAPAPGATACTQNTAPVAARLRSRVACSSFTCAWRDDGGSWLLFGAGHISAGVRARRLGARLLPSVHAVNAIIWAAAHIRSVCAHAARAWHQGFGWRCRGSFFRVNRFQPPARGVRAHARRKTRAGCHVRGGRGLRTRARTRAINCRCDSLAQLSRALQSVRL